MELKLGLDIGIASVGWGIIDENYNVLDSGVRLFSEGTAAKNLERRSMRGSRRRTRRRQHRIARMGKLLAEILNIDLPELTGNIYEIRCRGLREKLSNEEVFLAIMHLTKRRGTHFLTAEDFDEASPEGNTAEILAEQAKLLNNKYVCEIQYEKFQTTGKVRGIENRFRNKEYLKELAKLLDVQGEYNPTIAEHREEIETIYNSKREYYEGPGSEKSPTPYGQYRYDEHGNVIKVNLIDIMRGKCTFYPEEKRIANASYTACLFNLLNDFNNLKAAGNSLTFEQKKQLVDAYINNGKNINLMAIKKITGIKQEEITGYRVDKNDKPLFTEFKGYKEILKAYQKCDELTDMVKGNRKLIDDIAEILTKEKSIDERKKGLCELGISDAVAQEIMKAPGFTKYHSLSQKAMEQIMDDLWETDQNQMQLFYKAGLIGRKNEALKSKTLKLDTEDWIVSPVTLRAVNETVKVINAARELVNKKYHCEFTDIVIEMPRDKNSDEQKTRINRGQKANEKQRNEVECIVGDLTKINGKQYQMIRLLIEQKWKCAYSGENITLNHVLQNRMEIDHIIPQSLSFDDSQGNKVAVLIRENQQKGQRTPFQYLKNCSDEGHWSYEEFKREVLGNEKYSRKKKEYLCYEGDVQKDVWGFIGRNLADTRYASKKVLNLLQDYARINNLSTKVKVITGAFTSMFRKKARLAKDREATFAHHAQDALIIAGLSNTELMKKMSMLLAKDSELMEDKSFIECKNGRIINRKTGEVISEDDFKAANYIQFIKNVEKRPQKYSHKVDRKPNRGMYDQQIKSTRMAADDKGKEEAYIVTKYKNIYATGIGSCGDKLKKLILEKPECLLMYQHDQQTFQKLKDVVEGYPDSKNPFADYKAEHGYITKYAKHNNGPVVMDIKFLQKKLGNYRPNTKQQGKNMSVYLSIKTLRADIYQDKDKYTFVTVPYDMIDDEKDGYRINMEKYRLAMAKKKISADAEFCFSLYSGEMFSYDKEGMKFKWLYSCVNNDSKNCIETKFVDCPSPGNTQGKRMITIGGKISNMHKYNVDILGNCYSVNDESFTGYFRK